MEQAWKIYNEEQANKKLERTKKLQRNLRKLELKKEKVITKLQKHDAQVAERRLQKEQAIQLKRELNQRLQEERKEMQNRIKEIDRLENRQLQKAIEKQAVDGAPPVTGKKGKKGGIFKRDDMISSFVPSNGTH